MVPYFLYDLALDLPMIALILVQRRVDGRLELMVAVRPPFP